ncbi:hypothetical protein [Campylobacter sp. MG1]|uniref:hypothetical protein n=1 Tax=Campylobacter sp. MG1 TaxID=2976332 RepID=UPI00226D320E|nr:hypothetical protein [Campylobacter sp. MG1]
MKKIINIFAFTSIICVVIAGFITYNLLDKFIDYKHNKMIENIAISDGKEIVDRIHYNANNAYNNLILSRNEILSYIKKYINDINAKKHNAKIYAFNSYGIYLAHYLTDYKKYNAFLEKDINGKFYIKDLLRNIGDDGVYNDEVIMSFNNTKKHIVTYIKKDKNLNIYYGSIVDLDEFINNNNFHKNDKTNIKILIIISVFIFIILIILLKIMYENRIKK